MIIRSVRHKGLKRLIQKNDPSLLPAQYVSKIRRLLLALSMATDINDFLALPHGRPHKLKGDRSDSYAISVYANWRLTFIYMEDDQSLHILDFEDYH
ncbi:type II toxin-antitoxin system RelE/ParE family toxin [Robiginitomaculum antarcticum]|uniref:type II toxin-antitoxin system RelE/ParE family toxin n=1 Tax=Robiginitomaculum antarcticum TaxID=437507 RepID=UPI0014615693|nr:type II toxin-antitoxin system RelE/ParE family toxin [Robiginitomaculum antarcticum]